MAKVNFQELQKAGEGDHPLPELVALLAEPLNPSAEFVQGAVEHGLARHTGIDPNPSEDYVTGEFPVFFIRFAGRLLQAKFMPLPYFDEKCRPFVNGEPESLLREFRGRELKAAVKEHQAWISIALMNANEQPEDAYTFVGGMLSALIIVAEPLAVIWPEKNRIRAWDYDMLEPLETGNLQLLFE